MCQAEVYWVAVKCCQAKHNYIFMAQVGHWRLAKIIEIFSHLFGHLYIDSGSVQMNSCTDGFHVPDMKQKENHEASNTVHVSQSFIGNFRETSLLVTHIACGTPPVLYGTESCPLPATLCILLPYNLQAAISSEECILRCSLKTFRDPLYIYFSASHSLIPKGCFLG